MVKLVELHEELRRRARRRGRSTTTVPLPHLWALTPTLSEDLLAGFRGSPVGDLPAGFFGLADQLGTTIVALSRLPATADTLWLRRLGRAACSDACSMI